MRDRKAGAPVAVRIGETVVPDDGVAEIRQTVTEKGARLAEDLARLAIGFAARTPVARRGCLEDARAEGREDVDGDIRVALLAAPPTQHHVRGRTRGQQAEELDVI